MTIFVLFSVVSVANRTSTCHCPDSTFHSHQVNEHQSTSAFTTAVTQRGQLAHFSRKLSLKKNLRSLSCMAFTTTTGCANNF